MRSCALVLVASMSTEMLSAGTLKRNSVLVFLRRLDAHRGAKSHWNFTSLFGATKNIFRWKKRQMGLENEMQNYFISAMRCENPVFSFLTK